MTQTLFNLLTGLTKGGEETKVIAINLSTAFMASVHTASLSLWIALNIGSSFYQRATPLPENYYASIQVWDCVSVLHRHQLIGRNPTANYRMPKEVTGSCWTLVIIPSASEGSVGSFWGKWSKNVPTLFLDYMRTMEVGLAKGKKRKIQGKLHHCLSNKYLKIQDYTV